MLWSQNDFNIAIDFAAVAHGKQQVPGKSYSYLVHLANVAMEVMTATAVSASLDGNLAVLCALLHDSLEDTPTNRGDIERQFGTAVADGVEALTKDKKLPKPHQMEDSLDRILKQPPEIGIVKMADRITNLQAPPGHWSKEKIQEYLLEAVTIHRRLGHLNAELERRLSAKIADYRRYLA